jgi:hypothetical protein
MVGVLGGERAKGWGGSGGTQLLGSGHNSTGWLKLTKGAVSHAAAESALCPAPGRYSGAMMMVSVGALLPCFLKKGARDDVRESVPATKERFRCSCCGCTKTLLIG